MRGCSAAFRADLVDYADRYFVILSCGRAEEALAWTRAVMARLGLSLNEAKTSVKDARTESFDFLGYTLGPKFAHKADQSIRAQVHPRKASNASRTRSAIS